MTKFSKIAVVVSSHTSLSCELITKLVEQNYFVFGFSGDQKSKYSGLTNLTGFKLVDGCTADSADWERLAIIIYDTCDELDLSPRVDLMINIPSMESSVDFDHLGDFELDLVLREGLFGTLIGIQSMLTLLKLANKSNIANIYNSANYGSAEGIANSIASASLDILTRCLTTTLEKDNVSINSVCVDQTNTHTASSGKALLEGESETILALLTKLVEGSLDAPSGEILYVQGNKQVVSTTYSALGTVYV